MTKEHLLFVCSGNLDRSPTAEDLFRNSLWYEAKSCGTHPDAIKRVNQNLINWADKIFVMSEKENGHLTFLNQNFDTHGKAIYDLEIPDIYPRGDLELVKLLKNKLSKYLEI